MKFPIIAALALLSTPAFAWTNTNNGHNNQIVDGGPGAQANAKGGHGGAGGSATGGNASGGSSTATGGNVAISGLPGGISGRAPDITVAPGFASGMDCPTVGFGAGGSGLGGGGGFGPSWISSDCNKRKVAALLAELYSTEVARAYVEANIPGVREAVIAVTPPQPTRQTTIRVYSYDWCRTRNAGDRNQHRECEGRK